MPRIQNPHFNLHQITVGQYTAGNEFILKSGEIYIGGYHILPTGQRFTGFRPEKSSVEIFEKRLNPTEDILKYNQINDTEINRYEPPISYYPNPTMDDYKRGIISRFFVQRRNSTLNSILEIDSQQYNQINIQNNPGINGIIWNKVKLEWRISKLPLQDVKYLNEWEIRKNIINFPHLDSYLTNTTEFYR